MTLLFGTLFMAMLGIMGGSLDIEGGSTFGIAIGVAILVMAEIGVRPQPKEPSQ